MVEYRQLDSGDCTFLVRPNRALNWAWMKRLFLALGACISTVAIYFASQGAWLVLPFAGMEIGVLAIGLYMSARWSNTWEEIAIRGSDLMVSSGRRTSECIQRLPRHWTQVVLSRDPSGWYPSRLFLRCHGKNLEVGTRLVEQEREQLAKDLQNRLSFHYTPRFAEPSSLPEGLGAAEQKI